MSSRLIASLSRMATFNMLALLSTLAFAPLALAASSVTYISGSAPTWYAQGAPFLTLDNNIGFYFQTDGNFVVYNGASVASNAVWNSASPGQSCQNYGSCELAFQSDGNFVAYAAQPFWSTGTNSHQGYEDAAYSLILANSPPYVSLFDDGGNRLWYSQGANGFVKQDPDDEGRGDGPPGSGGGGNPCTEVTCCTENGCTNPPR